MLNLHTKNSNFRLLVCSTGYCLKV